ncbi:MAG TPA: hypothetical protein VGJ20_46495 [Xanthobacteraceae bacterium]|jgi:hypothetical protein
MTGLTAGTAKMRASIGLEIMAFLLAQGSLGFGSGLLSDQRKDAVSGKAHAARPNDCEHDFDAKRRDGD